MNDPTKLTQQKKQQIDSMSQMQLLEKIRFAPVGDPDFQGEVGEYILKRSRELQSKNPQGHTQASKTIGWE